jgi:Fic family protein
MPLLVKIGLAHVQFETIHPFLDGNGRLGRLLITFLLCERRVLRESILYISLYLKVHRAVYYELLNRVREKGDWEAWLDFFLCGVKETADQAAHAARQIVTLFETHQRQIGTPGRAAPSAFQILQYMQKNPIVSIPSTARKMFW